MKLDRGFKIKSSNPTAEMPKISFSCGLDNLITGRTPEVTIVVLPYGFVLATQIKDRL